MYKSITYMQLNDMAARFAGYLGHIGMKPGERIAIMMPNNL